MSLSSTNEARSRGRPREDRVTKALLQSTLAELAEKGVGRTTVAGVAEMAGTSKQAIYRRYRDKPDLIAAAVAQGFEALEPVAPQRSSVAEDLRQFLSRLVGLLQETPLGAALRALASHRTDAAFAPVFQEVESVQRLALRQILIATPFEADMEMRIDLLLGLVYFRLLLQGGRITQEDIERAIYLVLGLVAPRDPSPFSGLPGT